MDTNILLESGTNELEILEFTLGDNHYGINVAKIREIANQLDIPIADAYAEWQLLESQGVDTTALLANGLNHPNAEMHKVFANKLYDVIFM